MDWQVVAAARQFDPDIVIIVLTGHGSLDTAVEGIHFNVFDYLRRRPSHHRLLSASALASQPMPMRSGVKRCLMLLIPLFVNCVVAGRLIALALRRQSGL